MGFSTTVNAQLKVTDLSETAPALWHGFSSRLDQSGEVSTRLLEVINDSTVYNPIIATFVEGILVSSTRIELLPDIIDDKELSRMIYNGHPRGLELALKMHDEGRPCLTDEDWHAIQQDIAAGLIDELAASIEATK